VIERDITLLASPVNIFFRHDAEFSVN